MSSKTNEILNDIIQAASQAIVADDEVIKRHVMADIVDAIASVIPTERTALVGRDVLGAPHHSAHIKTCAIPDKVIAKSVVGKRRFYADAEMNDIHIPDNDKGRVGYVADVYEMDKNDWSTIICKVEFNTLSSVAVARMLRGLMRGVASHFGANGRKKANRRARKALQQQEGVQA